MWRLYGRSHLSALFHGWEIVIRNEMSVCLSTFVPYNLEVIAEMDKWLGYHREDIVMGNYLKHSSRLSYPLNFHPNEGYPGGSKVSSLFAPLSWTCIFSVLQIYTRYRFYDVIMLFVVLTYYQLTNILTYTSDVIWYVDQISLLLLKTEYQITSYASVLILNAIKQFTLMV